MNVDVPRARIIYGWLEDVYPSDDDVGKCEDSNITSITSISRPQKRKAESGPESPQPPRRQYTANHPQDPQALMDANLPQRNLRSRARETALPPKTTEPTSTSAYTASFTRESATALDLKLTSATTLTQSSKASRTRSRSPAKTVRDLDNANPPTRFLDMLHRGKDIPTAVHDLNKKIKTARNKHFFPAAIRSEIAAHIDQDEAEDDHLFLDETNETETEAEEHRRILNLILEIHGNAIECFESGKPEASWGEEVVRPLLNLAVRRKNPRGTAVVENVASTLIQPPYLAPRGGGAEALPHERKKVDYCLFVKPSQDEAIQLKHLFNMLPSIEGSLNQTQAYYTREKAQFASIELKQALSPADPLLQLAIWNSALFERLDRILELGQDDKTTMLPIPSLQIISHEWKACYNYIDTDGRTRIMRGLVDIGSTNTVMGIYQILRSLEVIVNYGIETYWPWLSGFLLSNDNAAIVPAIT